MWLLHILPESIILLAVYSMLAVGFLGLIATSFLRVSFLINLYRIPLQLLFVAILAGGLYWYGGYSTEMLWRAEVAKLEEKIKESENKAPIITKEIVTKYKDKIVVVKQGVEVIKKEIEIKREVINEGCKLNPTAVEIYNKGIIGPKEEKVPAKEESK